MYILHQTVYGHRRTLKDIKTQVLTQKTHTHGHIHAHACTHTRTCMDTNTHRHVALTFTVIDTGMQKHGHKHIQARTQGYTRTHGHSSFWYGHNTHGPIQRSTLGTTHTNT